MKNNKLTFSCAALSIVCLMNIVACDANDVQSSETTQIANDSMFDGALEKVVGCLARFYYRQIKGLRTCEAVLLPKVQLSATCQGIYNGTNNLTQVAKFSNLSAPAPDDFAKRSTYTISKTLTCEHGRETMVATLNPYAGAARQEAQGWLNTIDNCVALGSVVCREVIKVQDEELFAQLEPDSISALTSTCLVSDATTITINEISAAK